MREKSVMPSLEALKRDLIRDSELRETHISLVLLTADAVLKIKKPVSLGFLDFSSLSERKRLCEREVELNRRLAPNVYRGVVPIVAGASGDLSIGGPGEPVEWAVEMRRLPDADNAQARLERGALTVADVRALAARIARFHEGARCDEETSRFGEVAAIERNVRENFEQTKEGALQFLSPQQLAAIERFQLGFLREHGARFAARIRARRVRDGHGDLRLEHCYIDERGEIAIIDCIEFNDRFRYGDVASDIAFLAMDLAWHERHDLSEALLAAYARATGDYDLYGVVDFYESYRAFVRGKVSLLLASDEHAGEQARARGATQARKYFLLAEAAAREPVHEPVVYAVGGIIASGKSTVADRLGELAHAPVVDADRTRKQLAGVAETTPLREAAFSGHYSPQSTRAVYEELRRRAAVVLESGRSVVIDASFRDREQRRAARALAGRFGVPFFFIECRVDPEVSRARLAERARGASVSDGRAELLDAFMASYQPVDELPEAEHLRLDTSRPIAETVAELRARLRLEDEQLK